MGSSPSCLIKKDLSNTVVLITGANTGIGKETALKLAEQNATLILGCRSEERTRPILNELKEKFPNSKVDFFKLDLSDLDSVVNFSKQVSQKYQKIDTLLNNAGIMKPMEKRTTKQNFEIQIGTNHFGHFVLTNQLLPLIKNSKEGRIINVSSKAHNGMFGSKTYIDFDDISFDKKEYNDNEAYAQSKLANILFTKQLQKVLDSQNTNIRTVCLHPGVIKTELGRHMAEKMNFATKAFFSVIQPIVFKTPVQGAQTNIYCCLEDHSKLVKGAYYSDLQVAQSNKLTEDNELIQKFWEFSNNQVKQYLRQW